MLYRFLTLFAVVGFLAPGPSYAQPLLPNGSMSAGGATVEDWTEAKAIHVFFDTDKAKRTFSYSLEGVGRETFTQVLPNDGMAVSPKAASEPDQSFDPAKITTVQVQGDWKGEAVDIFLDKIELVPPSAEMEAQRQAHAQRLAKAAERKRQEEQRRQEETERLITGAPHPQDGPKVTHVGAVIPDTIALTIEAGEILPQKQYPLELAEGVQIVSEKNSHDVLCMEKNKVVDVPKGRDVVKQVEGQRKPQTLGKLVVNSDLVSPGPIYQGTQLTTVTVQEPRAYRILSSDDPAYAQPQQPAAVHVKSKPTGEANNQMSIRYHVYLTLPSPLEKGAEYKIQLMGVNTRELQVAFTHNPRKVRSESIHVTQIGYRPNDPFQLADNVWQDAFRTSMHGFLSHRSGIELGKPFTEYERPRPMHPDDGFKIFQLDVTFWNGEADSVHRCFRRLLGPELDMTRLKAVENAWGGYMDAGDWDRRSQHLTATWSHLELLDLFPDYFKKVQLALPPEEANDRLPDVLNEAFFNLDFYRRLQGPDGGVSGGVESTSHPRPGEASWQESLLLGAFAPDPETSLRYAACAARAARLLNKYDSALAKDYAISALQAWTWAEANEDAVIARESQDRDSRRGKDPEKLREAVRNMRALAAVALYRLTEDTAYHMAFMKATDLGRDGGDPGKQLESVFAYVTLSDNLADATLKSQAVAWFEQAAADSMPFADGNPFSVTCRVPQLPVIGYVGYYSVPETTIGAVLPRAHYLTGNDEYLRAALAAANYSAGANPMNMTLTSGVGINYPRQPLHVDSQHAGIAPPVGITVYGMTDPAIQNSSVDWAHTWYLSKSMIPGSRTWPTAEAYADLGNWPTMTEYTIHQTFGPTSFYWGYLAARE